MPTRKKPSYLLHRHTGQARVRINGRDHYLGKYGLPESRDRYDDLIAEWLLKNGDTTRYTLTVDELVLLFMEHAAIHYRKNGRPTSEVNNLRIALRPLVRLYGPTRAREFSPRRLKAVRDAMIEAGCVRTSINRQVGRIKRMFRWAVENEYVSADVLAAISAVAGLRKGRSEAEESDPVKPVPAAFVEAVKPHVTEEVWAMIGLQELAGMRPGEVTIMRTCDIDTTGRVWTYTPESHKTEHHGRGRFVALGPQAQAVLRPWLCTDLTAYLFSPRRAMERRHAERKRNRRTPMTPSQRARSRKVEPVKRPGERYTTASYGYAIRKACAKAEVPQWAANQLRHNAATRIRKEFGIESARVVLGHGSAAVTEVYAELDYSKAREIAARIG